MDVSSGTIFLSELLGTATLILLGCGVVANVTLRQTTGFSGGFLMVTFGWAIGVFAGVYVAYESEAHINPAVTLGLLASGADLSAAQVLAYLGGQLLGAILGATLCWLAYRQHLDDAETEPEAKRGIFSTAPGIRHPVWNLVTEAIATFVLVFVIIAFGQTPSGLGPLAVALLVLGIGVSLGGPTGYAINPARDLGPRIAHAALPFSGKGDSDWGYAWVPVVGPIAGGVLAGLLANALGYV